MFDNDGFSVPAFATTESDRAVPRGRYVERKCLVVRSSKVAYGTATDRQIALREARHRFAEINRNGNRQRVRRITRG